MIKCICLQMLRLAKASLTTHFPLVPPPDKRLEEAVHSSTHLVKNGMSQAIQHPRVRLYFRQGRRAQSDGQHKPLPGSKRVNLCRVGGAPWCHSSGLASVPRILRGGRTPAQRLDGRGQAERRSHRRETQCESALGGARVHGARGRRDCG
ncbi:hypothetical protein PHYSODRAFT_353548 [Phytophthora sojae]|uniref:Uncharacterized protein n=1 Tax=Phytophthora sojae (strain P6497) TaxID=1094619 RepID=G4YIU8_PHYSP|nr:hypothetical protein PHYSODRAFT_353548 [Phytophthora sojae]EGZ28518.1 hypothetical protein PHYSODRAFT_353548 [Phytophthora sojae]|eukprot:XP_009515793.1 hypothetical protein PHYSODRAFT_353548 [Phytophthora sojae]